MRALGADEAALWARVTAEVRRLHAPERSVSTGVDAGAVSSRGLRVRGDDGSGEAGSPPPAAPAPKVRGRVPPARPPAAAPPPPPRPGTLDGSWDRRLASGRAAVDRVVDLHGHDLDGAWHVIDRALDDAVAAEDRLLLLVTGKPPRDVPPHARGRIRAAVGNWLAASRHAHRIAAVRPAASRHGGTGALYVVLRRNKG